MFRVTFPLLLVACSAAPTATDNSQETDDHWDVTPLREKCFGGQGDDSQDLPDYDSLGIKVGRHCSGTNHQDIEGVERVVFLGDSITVGTPPTGEHDIYRAVLTRELEEVFGELQVDSCAEFGARSDELLLPPHQQILNCFPEPEPKSTLVVLTMGGNDAFAFAEDFANGATEAEIVAAMDQSADLFDDAIRWFKDNEAEMFPGRDYVIFSNVYEFTDGEGDLGVCPGAALLGFEMTVPEIRQAYVLINERYVKTAADTGTDVIFLLERFCGHGFHAGEQSNECYLGADAEVWFDGTCIHPNAAGHQAIAEMFLDVVNE